MNSLNKILKESSINFTGSILGNLLGYIWLIMMTRYFSQDDIGNFTLAQSFVNISLIFGLLGTHRSLDRFIPIYLAAGEPGKIKSLLRLVFTVAMIGSALIGILLFLSSDYLGEIVFDNLTLSNLLRIIVFSIPLLAATMIITYAFTGYKELRYHVYLKQIIEPSAKIIFMVLVAVFGLGLIEWTWFYITSVLITAGIGFWFLVSRILRPLNNTPVQAIKVQEIISYSWPISIASIMVIVIGQIDYLIIGIYHPSADVGIYRIYIQIAALLKLVLESTARIFKPVISELITDKKYSEVKETYRRLTKWIFSLTMAGFLIILLYGNTITGLLFTKAYAVYPIALSILAFGILVNASFGPEGVTLQAFGNTKLTLINSLVMLVTNVGLGFLLIPKFGIIGAAIATATTLSIGGLIGYLEINFLYKVQPFSLETIKYLAIGGITGGLFFGINSWLQTDNIFILLLLIILMIGVYAAGFVITRSLDNIDREAIQRLFRFIKKTKND